MATIKFFTETNMGLWRLNKAKSPTDEFFGLFNSTSQNVAVKYYAAVYPSEQISLFVYRELHQNPTLVSIMTNDDVH